MLNPDGTTQWCFIGHAAVGDCHHCARLRITEATRPKGSPLPSLENGSIEELSKLVNSDLERMWRATGELRTRIEYVLSDRMNRSKQS